MILSAVRQQSFSLNAIRKNCRLLSKERFLPTAYAKSANTDSRSGGTEPDLENKRTFTLNKDYASLIGEGRFSKSAEINPFSVAEAYTAIDDFIRGIKLVFIIC